MFDDAEGKEALDGLVEKWEGLSKGTKVETRKIRRKTLERFAAFLKQETGLSVEESVRGDKEEFSRAFGRYLFQLRVTGKSGQRRLPSRQTAEGIKSNLKNEIIDRYRVDITDPCIFPSTRRKWASFVAMLKADDPGGSSAPHEDHRPQPEAMLKVFRLLAGLEAALRCQKDEEGQTGSALPAPLQRRPYAALQWGVALLLTMFRLRRTTERPENLEANTFEEVEDKMLGVRGYRRAGSQGVIPDIDIGGLNPFSLLNLYLSLLPSEPNQRDGKRFLFPRPRCPSGSFDPLERRFDPLERRFEINQKVGKNEISQFVPRLFEKAGVGEAPSTRSVRATAILLLRQHKLSWDTVARLTGHETLVLRQRKEAEGGQLEVKEEAEAKLEAL
jgi:hypothetical protein